MSDAIFEQSQSLCSGRTLWDRLIGRMEPRLWIFEKIAETGEAQVIPSLLNFVLSTSDDVKRAAASAIRQLFDAVEAADYIQLDELTRTRMAYERTVTSEWRDLKPSDLESLNRLPDGSLLVGLATFHNNGYVREAAVQKLAQVKTGTELPFLLIRLNDWVGQVRAEALRVVLSKVRPDYAKHFLRNLRLVDRLRHCGRDGHTKVIQAIENLLTLPDTLPLVMEGIASTDRWLRRQCFHLLAQLCNPEDAALLGPFLAASRITLRSAAVRAVAALDGEHYLNQLLSALKDAHPGVSKAGRLALGPRLSLLDTDSLWKTFVNAGLLHVRRNVLLLLFRFPTWSRLRFVVMACADSDVDIAALARQQLRCWQQSAARSTPTKSELAMLRQMLADYDSILDREFVRQMRFIIQTCA